HLRPATTTLPSPENFSGECLRRTQKCSPHSDLSDPMYHSPPLAAATPPLSPSVVGSNTTIHHHHHLHPVIVTMAPSSPPLANCRCLHNHAATTSGHTNHHSIITTSPPPLHPHPRVNFSVDHQKGVFGCEKRAFGFVTAARVRLVLSTSFRVHLVLWTAAPKGRLFAAFLAN
nr:hypothetical protein [Tanacetum cinerariifolium]